MNTISEKPKRNHTYDWLLVVLLAFIAGFLLAWWLLHRQPAAMTTCPQTAASSAATQPTQKGGGAMQGGGAPGTGTPLKLGAAGSGTGEVVGNSGTMSGSGKPASLGAGDSGDGDLSKGRPFDASGKTVANGTSGSADGDGGQIDGGSSAGGGQTQPADDQSQPQSAASGKVPDGMRPVTADSGGALQSGAPDSALDADASRPAGNVVAALDYRYDKSGLPHYPNAIKVASGTDAAAAAIAAGPNVKNFSVTEILTDDAPDIVADWYHKNLPADWHEFSMPSATTMDQTIQQTKTPQPGQSPVDALVNQMIVGSQLEREKPGVDAARAAGLTIFQPADQNTDRRMILVIKDSKTGKTGVLLMKKADGQ